jgi:hypothetical protein
MANISFSFEGWPEGKVRPSRGEMVVIAAAEESGASEGGAK